MSKPSRLFLAAFMAGGMLFMFYDEIIFFRFSFTRISIIFIVWVALLGWAYSLVSDLNERTD